MAKKIPLIARLEKRYKKAQANRKKKNGLTAEQYKAKKVAIFAAQKRYQAKLEEAKEERRKQKIIEQMRAILRPFVERNRPRVQAVRIEGIDLFRATPYSIEPTPLNANDDIIFRWLKRIEAMGKKLFTIRVTYQDNQTKEISKTNAEINVETWWITNGGYWQVMADSTYSIFNAGYVGSVDDISDWEEFMVGRVATMTLLNEVPVVGNPGIQLMREGIKHCIFDKLRAFFVSKVTPFLSIRKQKELEYCITKCDMLAVKYDNGIELSKLETELKPLQVTVYIYRMDESIKCVLNPKSKYRYNFLNTRFNHCESMFSDTSIEKLDLLQMKDRMKNMISSNIPFRYEQGKTFIKRIMTTDGCYTLNMPYDDSFSKFNTQIEREYFNVDYINEKPLFEYIQEAGNHNTHMQFKKAKKDTPLKEVDCKAGYTQFKQAPVYKGFLGCVWDYCYNVTMEDVKKNIGIYTVRIVEVHPRYTKHFSIDKLYTLTSPLIEFLDGEIDGVKRATMEVQYGIYGSHFDMEFPENFMNKCDMTTGIEYTPEQWKNIADKSKIDAKPYYSLWVGSTAAASTHRKICSRIDHRLIQEYNKEVAKMDWVYDDECYEYVKQDGITIRNLKNEYLSSDTPPGYGVQQIEKESSTNCPQIFAFVTDYMRQNMLYEMEKIQEKDIYSWKVDSIVYTGEYTFRSIFRQKEVKNDFLMSDRIFKHVLPINTPDDKEGYLMTHTIFTGAGGSGKSEYASKLRKVMYVAPMWSMNASFHNKYHCYATTPQRVFGEGCRSIFETSHYRPATIYFDEATMIDHTAKQKALALNKHIRILFGGDFDNLGRPFQTVFQSCMNLDKLHLKQFLYDYRSEQGDPIRELKTQIRKFMYDNYGDSKKLIDYVKTLFPNNIITKEDVIQRYTVKDWVLAATVKNRDMWTELLSEKGKKYYVIKHSEIDIAKAFQGEKVALKGDIIYEDNTRCELRHGFTIHSAQGKTIEENIYIDISNIDFDYCLLYTAISRAKKLSQIYLIE